MLQKLKSLFFYAFKEIFIYHHNSLNFRAKIFALMIAAGDGDEECYLESVQACGMHIYNDENRVEALILATKELLEKVYSDNGLTIDDLVENIVEELHLFPRYSEKINIDMLRGLISCSHHRDTITYQERILEFLQTHKDAFASNKSA